MEKNIKVVPIRHKNVQGKEVMYLKLINERGELLMNVGESSVVKIEEMLKEDVKTVDEKITDYIEENVKAGAKKTEDGFEWKAKAKGGKDGK